jgi:hypothetical protein
MVHNVDCRYWCDMITKEHFVLALLSVVSLCFVTVQIKNFGFNTKVLITENLASDVSNVTSVRGFLATGVAINTVTYYSGHIVELI